MPKRVKDSEYRVGQKLPIKCKCGKRLEVLSVNAPVPCFMVFGCKKCKTHWAG